MAKDVTHLVEGLHAKKLFLGITFEQLVLILYPLFLIPTALFWYRDLRRRRFTAQVPAGCIRLGLEGKSHAADEYDEKYDNGTKDQSKWKVKALFIHPIKSCAPIELDVVDVDAEGMTYDRKFAFAELLTPTKADGNGEKKPKWIFRTLRQPGYEKLALVKPEVWIPKVRNGSTAGLRRVEQEGCLIIRYPNVPSGVLAPLDRLMLKWGLIPDQNSFSVPFIPGEDHKYPIETVNIWKDDPTWINMGKHIPNGFKEWLGVTRPLSIFRVDPATYRKVFRCAPRKEDIGFQPAVGFQDAYPLHILNLASVHDVGNKVGKDVINGLSARRFRSNIVLEGPPAYDEDDWKRCRIGKNEMYCACHTVRCRVSLPEQEVFLV